MKIKLFILGLILVLSAILRFNRLGEIFIFGFDEEYQATYAWTLVADPHPIWIGVSSSFLDFYLGPYFTYFTALLLGISGGDPMITAYFAGALGVLTAGVIFFIGWKIFNLTTGAVASLLYATLAYFVFYDQKYWNTMFTPLIALLLFLTVILVKKSKWWWVLGAALFGSVLQTHLEPAPLFLIGGWYFIKGKYWKNIKLVLVCLVVLALFYWPLLVFDYFHNFSNITAFGRLKTDLDQSKISFDPGLKFATLFDSMGRFWFMEPGNPNGDEINISCTSLSVKPEFKFIDQYAERTAGWPVLSAVTLFLLLIFLIKSFQSPKPPVKLLGIFLAVALLSFLSFPGGSSEYYTLSFFTLFVFVPGILVSGFAKKYLLFLFIPLLLAIFLGLNTVFNASGEFGLGTKKVLIRKVMDVIGDGSFEVQGRGVCHNWEGWRYLFKVYGRMPAKSYTDNDLGWLYLDEISKQPVDFTVILAEDRLPLKEEFSYLLTFKEGGYRAYIIKNK
ncbi:glycosyltransferase family 39 protein [Candidatus Daviesbacteria bacterium]|nr:glycosyltransferase family 39 protein [Candidatus Daviesbacteria bacterium]